MDFGNWLLLQKKIRGRSRQIFKSHTRRELLQKKNNSRVEWKMRNDDDECSGWEHKKVKKKNENRLWTITKE